MLTIAAAASLMILTASPPNWCLNNMIAPPGQPCPILAPFAVFFDSARAEITPQAAQILEIVVGSIRDNGVRRILISGNTDTAGSASTNLALSRRRAESVRRFLVARGVAPDTIKVLAHGETRLLVETSDGVAEPQNRVVWIDYPRFENPASGGGPR